MNREKVAILLLAIVLAGFMLTFTSVIAEPFGADQVTPGTPERAPNDTPDNVDAWAGNVTYLEISGYSITQSWQGYFGNVTGTIMLADSNDNVMYNWSLASPSGEILASTNDTILWVNIQCFNHTATGTYTDESGSGGTTNLDGTNRTILEDSFNINETAVDGVDETFKFDWGSGETHEEFFVTSKTFSAGECLSTGIYSNAGKSEDGKFQEVLLYEPVTTSVVFASLLEHDLSGFDQATHDFEMLVLEDGHGSEGTATDYYFYVELE